MKRPTALGVFVTIVMTISLLPIVVVLVTSLSSTNLVQFPPTGFGFAGYERLFANEPFMKSLRLSLVVGLGTAVVATVLGVMAAMGITRYRFPGRDAVATFLMSPLMLPTIAVGLAMLLVTSQVGISRTPTTIVIAHTVVTTPYVVRVVGANLSGFDRTLERAARSLGATTMQTFRRVILPLIMPGVVAGAIFAFMVSWNEVNVTVFMAGVETTTLPVRIFGYVQETASDTMLSAVSSLLAIMTWVALFVVERVLGLGKGFGIKTG